MASFSPPPSLRVPSVVWAALVVSATTSTAWAQPQPQDPATAPTTASAQPTVEQARQHFETGVAAMQRQEWAPEHAAFEESMRLRRSASVALNLGVVLHQLGRLVEARVRLQEFNELATDQLRVTHAAQVNELLTNIARRLARVRFVELSPASAVVSVDGRRAALNETNEAVFDPGAHAVRVEATGHQPFEERVEVAAGATREMRVTLAEAPAGTTVATPHPAQPAARVRTPEFYERWWFWTAIGVVVVAGATVAVVRATATADPPPTTTGVVLNGIRFGGGL